MKHISAVIIFFLLPTVAYAHSKMDATSPTDGAVLNEAPTEIAFTFSGKLRLTKVEASHSSGGAQTIDLSDHTSFTNEFTLPIDPMGPGSYDIEWRGLGTDGHAMQGSFTFNVE
ncbi:copper resistance CopC family protein [Roseovarius aestuariivivens]|uniref:copper resistance CopC family protein n=1 Tax=Roseovarius aestuariivivens TaxID=1888910 RepID=UPI00108022C6|nr:copper resistance CopC family protein [Roseovarius aestuariivivens]